MVTTASVAVMGAAPAHAGPYWAPYTSDPHTWKCSTTPDRFYFGGDGYLQVQACVVRTKHGVQAVETIYNSSKSWSVRFGRATVNLYRSGGGLLRHDSCDGSELGPEQYRACFGKTLPPSTPLAFADVKLDLLLGSMSDQSPPK